MSDKVNITVELHGDIIIKTDKEKINENTPEIKNAKAGDYFY